MRIFWLLLLFSIVVWAEGAFAQDVSSGSQSIKAQADKEPPAQTFHGFVCSDDCSGHKAGYNWAAKYHITEAGNCGGKSKSFIEGCLAYAKEQSVK